MCRGAVGPLSLIFIAQQEKNIIFPIALNVMLTENFSGIVYISVLSSLTLIEEEQGTPNNNKIKALHTNEFFYSFGTDKIH